MSNAKISDTEKIRSLVRQAANNQAQVVVNNKVVCGCLEELATTSNLAAIVDLSANFQSLLTLSKKSEETVEEVSIKVTKYCELAEDIDSDDGSLYTE